MIDLQSTKLWLATPPELKDNAAFTSYALNTSGYDYVRYIIAVGAIDIDMVTLKLQESDDNITYTDVPGSIFGTSTVPAIDLGGVAALPSIASADSLFSIFVNLKGRKKWLQIVATGGNGAVGTYMCVIAELSRAEHSPRTAAERGLQAQLIV